MTNKEYIVSLRVSFITPIDVKAKTEKEALKKATADFEKKSNELEKALLKFGMNGIAEIETEEDYIEEQ